MLTTVALGFLVRACAAVALGHLRQGRPSANEMLKVLKAARASEPCQPDKDGVTSFATPVAGLNALLPAGGRVFLVGDDVLASVCRRGSPGLCCSDDRPCDGEAPIARSTGANTWEQHLELSRQGWRQLRRHFARTRANTASHSNEVFVLHPELPERTSEAGSVVSRIASFLQEKEANENDVMVLGLFNNNGGSLEVFDNYTTQLVRSVVNPFPGRAVLLGTSPQHPAGSAAARDTAAASCGPAALPGESDPPMNGFRSAIFVRNVWRELTNPRSRLVEPSTLLNAMAPCHRNSGCIEWKDAVVSMLAQLTLNTLDKIL